MCPPWYPSAPPKLTVFSTTMNSSGIGKKKKHPKNPRTPLDTRGCLSAGNTPPTSPTVSRRILSRRGLGLANVTTRSSDDSFIDVEGEISPTNLKATGSTHMSETIRNSLLTSKTLCPCFQKEGPTGSSTTASITCQKCQQQWHTTCANLTGLTQAAVKKLTNSGWKCPRCYISPYVEDQGKAEQFKEFIRISSDFAKFNEELMDNTKAIEFFNLHLRRLLINEEDYIKDSERITRLEKSIDEIKSLISSPQVGVPVAPSLVPDMEAELKELKDSILRITDVLINNHSELVKSDSHLDLTSFISAANKVTLCSSSLENSSASIQDNIETLKTSLSQGIYVKEEASESKSDRFEALESVIRDIDKQLHNINQHVCPTVDPSSMYLPDSSDSEVDGAPQLAVTPNTKSPHYVNSEPENLPQCNPYESYKENIIPAEVRNKVMKLMEESAAEFVSVGDNREVLYFGEYGYSYTGKKHDAKTTPLVIQELLDNIRPHLPDQNCWLNSCLVTRYTGNESHIPMHRDNEPPIDPESLIVTASLGKERTVHFSNNAEDQATSINVKDSSIYVMTRFSQDLWRHGISPLVSDDSDNNTSTEVPQQPSPSENIRYSFTFRHIAPHYINSTVIVGDSNTQNVKFGKGFGTLGSWVPGKRVKAARIQDIPPPKEIGPHRNLVIHTGINDLTNENRPPNRVLVARLRAKCRDIQTVYPNMRVYISLLLPTKSRFVNNRVTELNNLILDMAFGQKNMFVIDNSILGDEGGCMPSKYGRFRNSTPNVNDIVHLGREGIKVFCVNIKNSIMSRGRDQSRNRYKAGRGNYVDAVSRGSRG